MDLVQDDARMALRIWIGISGVNSGTVSQPNEATG
jgi:hypothetical protein